MSSILYVFIMGGVLFTSLAAQQFIPPIPWAYNATFFLVPVVFFGAAVTVPYPVMLFFAFGTGFLWDGLTLPLVDDLDVGTAVGQSLQGSDLPFGYSIFLYALMGSLMQGIRPLFRRGRWELPVLMTGVATALLLAFEYLFINFRSFHIGGLRYENAIAWKIATTALLSMLAAPVVFFSFYRLARAVGYQIRYDGLRR